MAARLLLRQNPRSSAVDEGQRQRRGAMIRRDLHPGPRPPAATRARDLLGFLAFSHGWTWAFWALAGSLGESVWDWPAALFFYLGGVGVPLGAVVMSRAVYGWGGLRELGRRCVDARRITARWWVVVVLLFPALTLVAAGVALAAGISEQPFDLSGARERALQPLELLLFAAFILILGPLPEEIGWRGYLLDRLQLRWSALVASLALAVVWWTWHLPLFVLPGYFDAFEHAAPSPWRSLAGLLPSAILYTWVYNNTARSVLAVIVLHFVQNWTGELLGIDPAVRPVRLVLEVVVAVGVVLRWGPRDLCGRGRRERPPQRPAAV